MKRKLKKIISIFLIELIILMPIAIIDALTISNVRTEETTQISTKVKWETDEPAEGKVNFGTTNNLGQTESSPNVVKDHSILLRNLNGDTTYYFEVASDTITDNNNGDYYEVITLPKKPLFVNASIPRYYSKSTAINIEGTSIRLARINMYVNSQPLRKLNAGNNGNFIFENINLNEGDNIIRFTAQSQSESIEEIYQLTVDTITPTITINEIPNVIGSETIIINGSVSEPVDISFYVTTGEEDITAPPKVMGLINTTVQANLVELSWDETYTEDFQQYIVYRNNKPLGIGSDSTYNDYSDVLVNSDQTYTYQVAAMDKNGNIGEFSDPITIKTLPGGRTDLPEEQVDIYETINQPEKTITTDNTFEEEIKLGKEDGFYNIKIEATDIAGNQWLFEKEVLLDTKDPEIEIITPRSNSQIFENYADMVTIRGKTEPGARVYLYVLRTPFGMLEDTWDISGFPDQIHQISEAKLRANCRLNIQGEEQCKTHSDYETIADANGYFEFEDIDLTSMWAGAFRITEYPTGAPYYELIRQKELKDFVESNLFFVAVDAAGRKGFGQVNYEIVTCWTTDLSWSVTPLIEYQSPTFLNVERLKEGTESIYFYFNFSYHGRGLNTYNTRITTLHVADACGYGYLEDQKRYNYSCDILRSCTEKLSPGGRTAYIACPLGRLEGIEKWSDSNWESFIDAVKDEMTFPFKLTITYDEEYENNTLGYAKTFNLCTEVGYVVDAAYINPRELLPDWLLYDFVDLLNKSISRLNDWILRIKRILEWAAIGCMVSFFVKFITQIYRRITCHFDRFFKIMEGVMQKIGGDESQEDDECTECLREFEGGEEGQAMKSYKANRDFQDLISDTCLEKCYPTCSSAWKSEESLYKTYRWACDRVFGHAAPSKWTETVSTNALYEKATAGTGCANDESVRGKPLRTISCKSIEKDYERQQFSRDDVCFEIVNILDRKKRLYTLGDPIGGDIYEIKLLEGPSIVGYEYVIKQNDNNYLTNQDLSCQEICSGEEKVPLKKITQRKDNVFVFEDMGVKKKPEDEQPKGRAALCTTTNQCLSFKKDNRYLDDKGKQVEITKDAEPRGYTKDCFYGATRESGVLYTGSLTSPNVVSGDPDQRMECCCINAQGDASPFDYYIPSDVETKDGDAKGTGSDSDPEALKNMEWSYRYNKINYRAGSGATQYDPNRYIEGRDQMACFGQNNWLYDGFTSVESGKTGNLLIIDPMRQHISALQCVAISQILNRLVLIRNIMVALGNCLLSIRTTGEADSGVCKELFTQYICSFIWKIISWFRDGCLPFGKGIDFTKSDNEILEAVSVGMKGVWDSVADSQTELTSEYGNAELTNLIGIGPEDVFRKVCLGAFGYDWEIDADSVIDIAYHSPYATLVQAILPSREYLTFDPTTAQAKYEYRSSWLINPGCDLDNYEVYLTCVTRNDIYNHNDIDCSKQKDPYGINCDCLDIPPENAPLPLLYYQSRARIKQNELQNVDSTQIIDRIKTAPYRYDHLMFKLNIDRNYIRNKGDTSKCFPQGHEDGIFYAPITDYTTREIAGCIIDMTSGRFSCKEAASFFYQQGMAVIDGVELGGREEDEGLFNDDVLIDKDYGATFYEGEYIKGKVKYSKDKELQCLIVRLLDENNQPFKEPPLSNTKVYQLRGAAGEDVKVFNIGYQVKSKDILSSKQFVELEKGRLTRATQPPEAGLTKWILHIDIRSPKGDNDCNRVKESQYDNSQIVIVDGIKQSRDIPILLKVGKRNSNQCDGMYATKPIPDDAKCICGEGDKENCPEEDKKYCVGGVCKEEPGATAVQKPMIDLDESRVYKTIDDKSFSYPLSTSEDIKVTKTFKITIHVDGKGNEVSEVQIKLAGINAVHKLNAPGDKKKGIWTKDISTNTGPGIYPLIISAKIGNQITEEKVEIEIT